MRKIFSILLTIIGYIVLWGGIIGSLLNIDMCFSPNFGYWLFSVIIFVAVGVGLIKYSKHLSRTIDKSNKGQDKANK